jgi:anti-sigma factor RsiW
LTEDFPEFRETAVNRMNFYHDRTPYDCSHGQIAAYIDGELPVPEARLLEDHMDKCSSCSEAFYSHQRLSFLLDDLLREPRPAVLCH